VIRANLLPPPQERLRIFGFAIERELGTAVLLAAATVAGAAAGTLGLETLACARLQGAVTRAEVAARADASVRAQARRLALDVARYQEFAREMAIVSRSGPERAAAVVRVGNAVPPRVWLDGLVPSVDHIDLTGTSASLETMGMALRSLDRALPGSIASLVHLEPRARDSRILRFAARLDSR